MRDYYCSRKFYSFKLDLEKKNLYNCCKSDPENIKIISTKENSSSIFNTETLVKERQLMLNNNRIKSCEKGCWIAEDKQAWSLRLQTESDKKTHLEAITLPEEIDLQLSSDCNLTCSYCCKEFSSAWRKDIINHGDYNCGDKDRYKLKKIDTILEQLSQRQKENSRLHTFIKNKLGKDIKNLSKLLISGGEPFIHNSLLSYIDIFKNIPDLKIITGLGFSTSRLTKVLDAISKYKNISIVISAESIGQNYEFNRYGNTYDHFVEMLNVIESYSLNYEFNTTYSNLTVFDYVKFYKKYNKIEKNLNMVYDPNFMSINVLDDISKDIIREDISNSILKKSATSKSILSILDKKSTEAERKNLEVFVKEFCRRRNIKPDFMPTSLKKWLNLL